jgi:tRNA(Ile)-lysidine synthase
MFKSFQNHINQNLPFLTESKLLIAISGGLDSVVLTQLCYKLELDFALAHCNFNLRGKESDADEAFVLNLAKDLNKECFIECFETEAYAKQHKLSIQMAARELRYNWFKELAEQLDFDYILTAHHADDNLETFLINLSRGTGLDGLIAIPEVNEAIVRPLLLFSREEIEAYANANNLSWREDASNTSTKYLRNKLRLELIPKLKEINPQLLQNFNNTITHLQDSKVIIDDRIDDILNQVIESINSNTIRYEIAEILKLSNPKAYLYEFLKDYNFTEWNDVYNLLTAQSGKYVVSATHRLIKDRDCLLLSKLNSNVSSSASDNYRNERVLINEDIRQCKTSFGTLFFEDVKQISDLNVSTIFIDKDKLNFPLTIRKYQEGDYFYPFGMQGKKKLSKYFKDEKLSLLDKEKVWILYSGDDIVWVINRRADNRFKVTESTKSILKIELK